MSTCHCCTFNGKSDSCSGFILNLTKSFLVHARILQQQVSFQFFNSECWPVGTEKSFM